MRGRRGRQRRTELRDKGGDLDGHVGDDLGDTGDLAIAGDDRGLGDGGRESGDGAEGEGGDSGEGLEGEHFETNVGG